jgi:WD40 repeat protein
MTETRIETTVTGGQIQGVVGAGTVVIENLTIYNRAVEESAGTDAAGEPIAPCPYPGLAYFGPGDADLFFGRDSAIARLSEAVGRQSLTALVGASGSGKSSVALAGLAPRLHAVGGWRFSHFRVGTEVENNPFLALARALVPLYVASASDTERLLNTKQLAARLQSGELSLRDVFADCRNRNKGTRILLIADQFEEAFTLVEDEALLHRFIDVLLADFRDPAPSSRPDICLILTLRADFYGRALRYRPLADALQGHVENLGPMNREELEVAISRPAEKSNVSFDPGLVETLLDEVESKPGSLPLLQFALREVWGRQEQRRITRTSYDAIGGVEGALAQRAETIFAAMTENGTNQHMEQDFRRLFTRLVTLGEGQEDTRRVVDRQELGDAAWSLAQRLASEDNRLVVTNAPSYSRETAEVVHEALIRHWPKLVDWIDRDRAFQSWLRQIRSNVELWSADPSDEGPLLRGGMLAHARDWLARRPEDLSTREQAYIEASLALQQRAEDEREAARQAEIRHQEERAEAAVRLATEQRRRARIALLGGIVALVFAVAAIVAGYGAFTAKREADQSASIATIAKHRADENAHAADLADKRAEAERDEARMQLLAIQARRVASEMVKPDDIERAAALALESIQLAKEHDWPTAADAVEVARSALTRLPLSMFSHRNEVTALVALADGRLVSGGVDGKIKLWPKDGAGEPVVLSHGSPVWSLAVLADGRLASGGEDGKIKLWPKEGKGEPAVLSHGSRVDALVAFPDGRLASGGEDGKVRVWPKDGTSKLVILTHGSPVWSLAVLADGRLASGGEDGKIKLWPKGGAATPVVLSPGDSIRSLVLLTDGRFASGGEGGDIYLWPKDGAGKPVVLPTGGRRIVFLAALAGGRFVSGDDDGTISVWPKDGAGLPVKLSHGSPIYSLAALADGRLASGAADGTIKIWPMGGAGLPVDLSHGDDVHSLAALPDGRLASGGEDGKVRVWPKDGASEPVVLSHGNPILSLAVLGDGRLASGARDGTIKIWPKDGSGTPAVLPHNEPVTSLAVLADGRLASGGEHGTIYMWPKDGAGTPVVLPRGSPVSSLAALADGRLASGAADGTIRIWPKDGAGEPMILLPDGSPILSLAVLGDGWLASSARDGTIKLWPKDGAGGPVVLSHGSPVWSLAVLADGRLASGDDDGTVKLWPKEGAGVPVVIFHGDWDWIRPGIRTLAVLADGRLASGNRDGNIKIWLVDEQNLIAALCLHAGRNFTKGEWARYVGSDTPWQPSCRDLPSNWRTPD